MSAEYLSWDAEQLRATKQAEVREERLRRTFPQRGSADTTAAGLAEAQTSVGLQSMLQHLTTLVTDSIDKQVSTLRRWLY